MFFYTVHYNAAMPKFTCALYKYRFLFYFIHKLSGVFLKYWLISGKICEAIVRLDNVTMVKSWDIVYLLFFGGEGGMVYKPL